MKTIFLDHDGVICLPPQMGSRHLKKSKFNLQDSTQVLPIQYRLDDFDKGAVQILNQILKETGAEIVVTSTWRLLSTVDEMREYYAQQGIIKIPIGFTPNLHNRTLEIETYLSENPNITNWVAVDDDRLNVENFVLTNFKTGLTESGIKEKIIKFLK